MGIFKAALGGGGGYFTIASFIAGSTFGAWVYSGQIAKRDIKLQDAAHAQVLVTKDAKIEAKEREIEILSTDDGDAAEERGRQTNQFETENRQLYRTISDLRSQLTKEKTDYYDTEIPDNSIDRINCAFRPSLCGDAGPGEAGYIRDQDGGEDQYSFDLAGAPG